VKKQRSSDRILNPAGLPAPSLPAIAPAPRLKTIRSKKLMLFDNGKVGYGNSVTIFEKLHDLLTAGGARKVVRLSKNAVRVPKEQIVEALNKDRPDGMIVALCDSGGITDYTIAHVVYEAERMGIPTAVIAAKSCAALCAMIAHRLMPYLALVELDDPVWPLEKEEIAKRTEEIYPDILRGLTSKDAEFREPFDLGAKYARFLNYPEGRFLEISAEDGDEAIYERLIAYRLCDGLPVIPPTEPRVEAMLRFCRRGSDDIIVPPIPPSWCPVTVEKLAINAVMAGCKAEYFPIILTAFEAMAAPEHDLGPTVSTTYNGGHLLLVRGPLAETIELESSAGCLGPGFRANATIGRAVALSFMNILRAFPGGADVSTFGSPAKFSYCFAENLRENPWRNRREQKETDVTVFKCEAPHNIMNHRSTAAEEILRGIASEASALGGNNCWWPGELFVLLGPDHSKIVYNAGWSEEDIKLFLYDHARNPVEKVDPDITPRGITPRWAKWWKSALNGMVPVVLRPDDIRVVVAGGGGPHSMVIKPWGISRSVTRPVRST
jgi:hypothetical protein